MFTSSSFKNCFFSGPEPRLFAHRGASAQAPENTLESFRIAWEMGVPYLELDVHLSLDGHPVVIHDSSVARITGQTGLVERMSVENLRRLDAGHQFTLDEGRNYPFRGMGLVIPTLDEVLEAFPEARLIIEIKPTRVGIVSAVWAALHNYEASDRVIVASVEQDLLDKFRADGRKVPTSFSKREVQDFLIRVGSRDFQTFEPPGAALQIPEFSGFNRVVSPALIEAAHQLGVEIHVWTVNEPARIERLLQWEVDGIITDDPGRAFSSVEVLNRRSRRISSREYSHD